MYLLGLCFSTDVKVSVEKRSRGRTGRTSRRSLVKMPLWTLALIQEDPTCCETAKPVHHSY